jgi:enoyl-[acyl-carrier protein] reductase I
MGLLSGKRILVTGVTAKSSIAFRVAEIAQQEGATIIVSNFGRALRLTKRAIAKLDPVPPALDLDVTKSEDMAGVADQIRETLGGLDGIVHSIAFADPNRAMGGRFLSTPWEDVATAIRISAYSMVELVRACDSVLQPGASIVGMTFESTVSWPSYDWMGVAKASLDSVSRYLARYLGPRGIRSNVVAAGPVNTLSKKAIPVLSKQDEDWHERAPLGWNADDSTPVAQAAVLLLSDWLPATSGEIIHVDGGFHSTGSA